MDRDGLCLADPVCAVIALIFDRRIPPPAQVNDMVRRNNIEPDASRLWRKQKDAEAVARLLERVHDRKTFFARRPAVDHRGLPFEIKQRRNSMCDSILHRKVLDEYE